MQNPKRIFRVSIIVLLFVIELLLAFNLYRGIRHYQIFANPKSAIGEEESMLERALTIAELQTAIPASLAIPQQDGGTIPEISPTVPTVPPTATPLIPTPTQTWTPLPTWTLAPSHTLTTTPPPPTATLLPTYTSLPIKTASPTYIATATQPATPTAVATTTSTPLPTDTSTPQPSATPIASDTPLPTATLHYVTPTPVAEGLFGAATQVAQITADARTTGTATPLPSNWRVYTIRVLPYAPTPANQATAEYLALEATARAITTGEPPVGLLFWTATPRPTNTVRPTLSPTATIPPTVTPVPTATATPSATPMPTATPIVVTATFTPENVLAAATMAAHITEQARTLGTATPLPDNAVTATFTPRPIVVTNTLVPANGATATAQAVEATAIAFTTGTPDTSRYITATPTPARPMNSGPPTRTPTPLAFALADLTATPTPAATALYPTELVGKILFLGNMDDRGAPEVYAMDVDGSNVIRLSSREFYDRAVERDSYSADRRFRAFVKREYAGTQERQIYAYDSFYNSERQLTHMKDGSTSWDPVWSPVSEQIAFVSNQTDSDEIWLVDRPSLTVTQLTFNDGPWDKHPSWSPDGTEIVFTSSRSGQREIWRMKSDGSQQQQLTRLGFEAWDPVWVKYTDQ